MGPKQSKTGSVEDWKGALSQVSSQPQTIVIGFVRWRAMSLSLCAVMALLVRYRPRFDVSRKWWDAMLGCCWWIIRFVCWQLARRTIVHTDKKFHRTRKARLVTVASRDTISQLQTWSNALRSDTGSGTRISAVDLLPGYPPFSRPHHRHSSLLAKLRRLCWQGNQYRLLRG